MIIGEPRPGLEKPQFLPMGDSYHFEWPHSGVEVDLDRIYEAKGGLHCELTVLSNKDPRAGLLMSTNFNLLAGSTRKTLVSQLKERVPDVDWAGLLEQVCWLAKDRWRTGEPVLDLRTVVRPEGQSRWLIEPYVPAAGTSVMFALGGSGKSITAAGIAVTATSGQNVMGKLRGEPIRVMVCDWEDSEFAWQERIKAICYGNNIAEVPQIFYRRMTTSMADSAAEIHKIVTKLGIGLVILDSVGAALNGEPESAEVAIRFYNAIRSLGIPCLAIAHVARSRSEDADSPFGSVYHQNLARITWSLDRVQEPGEDNIVVGFKNKKANNNKIMPSHAYRFDFETDGEGEELVSISISPANSYDIPQLLEKMPLEARIRAQLQGGAATAKELGEVLGKPESTVRARLYSLVQKKEVTHLGEKRYGLISPMEPTG